MNEIEMIGLTRCKPNRYREKTQFLYVNEKRRISWPEKCEPDVSLIKAMS